MDDVKIEKSIPIKVSLPVDVHGWLLKRAVHNERSRGAELRIILKAVMAQETDGTLPISV